MNYLRDIAFYRHFWVHLAFSDIRARFRRSSLGLLWVALQPLMLTVIIASVLNYVFKLSFLDYSIYIFSGLIVWDFLTGCVNIGAVSFLNTEGYIRQVRLPMAIYPLKSLLYCSILFGVAFAGFAVYVLALNPSLFSWHWLYALPFFIALLIFGAPFAVISAIINIRLRDFQQFVGLLLQIVWYMSPVFMPRDVFDQPLLRDITALNPVASLMDMFRQPILHGVAPAAHHYALVFVWSVVLWAVAAAMLARNERKIIFYY